MMMHLSSRAWAMRATGISAPSEGPHPEPRPHPAGHNRRPGRPSPGRYSAGLASARLLIPLTICWLAFSSCSELSGDEVRQVNEALNDSLTSTTEAWNVRINIMEQEITKASLRGSYAATYTRGDSSETRIRGPVHIDVFDSTGAVTTRVRSDSAIYRAATLQFEFFGDVEVDTDQGRTLRSEYLRWNQGENTISTPNFVVWTTPSDTLAGTGLTGTADLSSITIHEARGSVTIH